jgi:hypothetical protein
MTLSYDAVFLALLRLAIKGERPEIKQGRCIAHPFKKRAYMSCCDTLEYCAYAYALLAYGKTVDDISDEKGLKKFTALLAKPFTKSMRKKALKKYADLDRIISEGLRKLSETESKGLQSVDTPADCFGELLAHILAYGLDGTDEKIMRNIGRHIGRWIYIIDAADDHSEDLKEKRFNPFINLYGEGELTEEQKRDVATSLKLELLAAEPAFDLIDLDKNPNVEGIIKNIIYRGMPDVADRVLELNGKSKRKNDKRRKGDRNG